MKKKEIDKILLNWEVPATKSKNEAWDELMSKINEPAPSKTEAIVLRKRIAAIVAVAAVVVLGVLYFIPSGKTELQFAKKQLTPALLPDGSKVWANAHARLVYDKETWNKNREVNLQGEAYFEVVKGSKFTVKTSHGDVNVLGTSFNVMNRKDFFEVECYTGKVAVTAQEDEKILTPGKATRLVNNHLADIFQIQELQADWMNDKFRFENQSLTQVFEELSDFYQVTFQLNFEGEKFYSGNFDNKDLETTLKTICLPMELNYSIQGDQVIISQ